MCTRCHLCRENVPSQTLDFLLGSWTSQTHFLEFLFTPWYIRCLIFLNFFLPSLFLRFLKTNMASSSDKFKMRALALFDSEDQLFRPTRYCRSEKCFKMLKRTFVFSFLTQHLKLVCIEIEIEDISKQRKVFVSVEGVRKVRDCINVLGV